MLTEIKRMQKLAGLLKENEESFEKVIPIHISHAKAMNFDMEELAAESHLDAYQEGVDYEWAIARGDDFPHALVIKNPQMLKDPELKTVLMSMPRKSYQLEENENVFDSENVWNPKFVSAVEELGIDMKRPVVLITSGKSNKPQISTIIGSGVADRLTQIQKREFNATDVEIDTEDLEGTDLIGYGIPKIQNLTCKFVVIYDQLYVTEVWQ